MPLTLSAHSFPLSCANELHPRRTCTCLSCLPILMQLAPSHSTYVGPHWRRSHHEFRPETVSMRWVSSNSRFCRVLEQMPLVSVDWPVSLSQRQPSLNAAGSPVYSALVIGAHGMLLNLLWDGDRTKIQQEADAYGNPTDCSLSCQAGSCLSLLVVPLPLRLSFVLLVLGLCCST